MIYHSNKAAVYFEMKAFSECILACDEAINCAAEKGQYDYLKLAKVMARKGNAFLQLKMYQQAINSFKSSLLENNDQGVKMQLCKVIKLKQDEDAMAYVDFDKAEEHRERGNQYFKENMFVEALKEYEEGIKRNPEFAPLYSNRCATYIKLGEFVSALKDADTCIEIDPDFIKAYARKGTCHHFLKEYHKALKAFDDGIKLDPQNKECINGKHKTITAIQLTSNLNESLSKSDGHQNNSDEERHRRAMSDPEIQQIMRDPSILQVLKDINEEPDSVREKMQDPYISDCVNKLVAAGLIKLG